MGRGPPPRKDQDASKRDGIKHRHLAARNMFQWSLFLFTSDSPLPAATVALTCFSCFGGSRLREGRCLMSVFARNAAIGHPSFPCFVSPSRQVPREEGEPRLLHQRPGDDAALPVFDIHFLNDRLDQISNQQLHQPMLGHALHLRGASCDIGTCSSTSTWLPAAVQTTPSARAACIMLRRNLDNAGSQQALRLLQERPSRATIARRRGCSNQRRNRIAAAGATFAAFRARSTSTSSGRSLLSPPLLRSLSCVAMRRRRRRRPRRRNRKRP